MKISSFQKKVYDALMLVPKGKVTTYKILGEHIGCSCYRAIGGALKRNPFAPKVPCHRVISADLTIGGFMGCKKGINIRKKIKMLESEGVRFIHGRLSADSSLFMFP